MLRSLRLGIVLSLIVAAGCGGDDDGAAPIDAPVASPVDAPTDAIDAPVVCGISTASFGALGDRDAQQATWQGGTPGLGLGELLAPLELGAEPDRLLVDLLGGVQFHDEPVVAGTVELTGEQLALSTCWVCVAIGAGWAPGAPPPFDHVYMATGGTVVINSIDPQQGGAFDVTLTNVTFQHAMVGPQGSTPINDGCVTRLDSVHVTGAFESDKSVRPPGQSGSPPDAISRRYTRQ